MLVELRAIKPNPFRDFTVDPLDQTVVANLTKSIKDHGFWGGVVCRKNANGDIECGGGWHRIKSAMKAGLETADIFVGKNISDSQLILIYASENALQRGNSGTAMAGTVLSAVRYLAKGVLTGVSPEIRGHSLAIARGQIATARGIGEDLVLTFLSSIPGITKNVVIQQLANIKSSGDYARIIRDVQKEIAEENKEALKALERAEREQAKREEEAREAKAAQEAAEERRKEAAREAKAAKDDADRKRAEADRKKAELEEQRRKAEAELAEKRRKEAEAESAKWDELRETRDTANAAADVAEEREKTFDLEGVAKHLNNASQLEHFRALVTGPLIKPYLAVNQQKAIAKRLVDELERINKERAKAKLPEQPMTARFVKENVTNMVLNFKDDQQRLTKEEERELVRQDWSKKAGLLQGDFARHARGMLAAALDLSDHAKKRPQGVTLHMTGEFRDAVKNAEKAVALIGKVIK